MWNHKSQLPCSRRLRLHGLTSRDLGLKTWEPVWSGKSQLPCSQQLRLHRSISSDLGPARPFSLPTHREAGNYKWLPLNGSLLSYSTWPNSISSTFDVATLSKWGCLQYATWVAPHLHFNQARSQKLRMCWLQVWNPRPFFPPSRSENKKSEKFKINIQVVLVFYPHKFWFLILKQWWRPNVAFEKRKINSMEWIALT